MRKLNRFWNRKNIFIFEAFNLLIQSASKSNYHGDHGKLLVYIGVFLFWCLGVFLLKYCNWDFFVFRPNPCAFFTPTRTRLGFQEWYGSLPPMYSSNQPVWFLRKQNWKWNMGVQTNAKKNDNVNNVRMPYAQWRLRCRLSGIVSQLTVSPSKQSSTSLHIDRNAKQVRHWRTFCAKLFHSKDNTRCLTNQQ